MRALLYIFSLVCAGNLLAQPNWDFSITDKSHNILFPSNLEGYSFQMGDYLGVFYEENDSLVCAGSSEYSEENFVLTAFGTSFSYPGFQIGQIFHFKHWNSQTNVEQEIFVEYNTTDFTHAAQFTIDGMSGITSIIVNAVPGCTDQTAVNYDISASYDNGTCISVFESLYLESLDSLSNVHFNYQSQIYSINEIVVLQEELIENLTSTVENQENEISDLNDLNDSLNLVIDSIQAPLLINLAEGWNMIGYPHHNEQNMIETLAEIELNILILKSNDGMVYMPQFNFNGIGNFIPGHGYQINIFDAMDSYSIPKLLD